MTFGPGSTYGEEGEGAETAYMILTWLGITVMVLAMIAWVVYENRRLLAYTGAQRRGPRPRGRRAPSERPHGGRSSSRRSRLTSRRSSLAMLVISIVCVIIVLIVVFGTNIGDEFRPTV